MLFYYIYMISYNIIILYMIYVNIFKYFLQSNIFSELITLYLMLELI